MLDIRILKRERDQTDTHTKKIKLPEIIVLCSYL